MHKLTDATGRVLYISRDAEAAAVRAQLARQVLPLAPEPETGGHRIAGLALVLTLMVLVVVCITITFFLFGEDRGREPQRPALTAQQRAQAFRL